MVVTHEIDSGLGEADAVLALRADGSVAYAGPRRRIPAGRRSRGCHGERSPSEAATVSAYRAILAKDLRVELRTLESVPAMVLFSATTFVLFRFGLDRESLSGCLAAGVLLATVLFAAILAINRVFVAEREQGGFDLIRLAPVDGTSLYLAKASALFIYLAAFELVRRARVRDPLPRRRRRAAAARRRCWRSPTSASPRSARWSPRSPSTRAPAT